MFAELSFEAFLPFSVQPITVMAPEKDKNGIVHRSNMTSNVEPPAPNKSEKKSVRQVRRKATVTEARRGTKGSETTCPHA